MEDSDPGPRRGDSSLGSSTDMSVESESGGGGGGWLGLTSSIARCVKRTIPPAIDGIADAIHRSALNVAAEFAEMERDAEREAHQWRVEQGLEGEEDEEDAPTGSNTAILPLPWELKPSGRPSYVEDKDLKKKIMSLSLDEATFKGPHVGTASGNSPSISHDSEDSDDLFSLDDSRVYLIKRLLDIDPNLAHVHARLSGRSEVKETVFWKNYFHHCDRVRDDHTMHDDEVDADLVEGPSQEPHPSSAPSTPVRPAQKLKPFPPASPPKVLSMEDLVLVGGDDDDLDHLAADITRAESHEE